MNIDEAIKHCLEVSKECTECTECAKEHYQLAQWLMELKEYRELAEENKLIRYYMYNKY